MKSKNGRHLSGYSGRDISHRHHCKTCRTRVFPYDSLETLTLAPIPGAKGGPVLLFSANSRKREMDPENVSRIAWCWLCNGWVDTMRESKHDEMLRYLKRNGVEFRYRGASAPSEEIVGTPVEGRLIQGLAQRLEDKRLGGGTIAVRKAKPRARQTATA